ncbi:MAG: PEGA domain-containing protein [Archangium sp.]
MSRLIPLMWVAVVISAPLAHAQKPRVVLVPFVPGDGVSTSAASKFNALVVDELKSRPDVMEYVASPATKAPQPESSSQGKRAPSAEAVGAIDAGRKAFDDLRFEDATASLRKGIDGMLADPATADYEAVTDAYVKLAASAFRQGEEKAAKDALLELARFAPNYVLPAGFPPVFQREFDKAKKRLDKQPKGSVSIEGPAGSTAFLDGRDLGMVPVLEDNVPGGTHYVMVEGTKGERYGQTINVGAGTVKAKASFGAGSDKRAVICVNSAVTDPGVNSVVDEGVQGRLGPYMRAVGADFAVVGYIYKTSDSQLTAGTAVYSAKKTAFTALTPVTFDTDVLTANTEAYKLGAEIVQRLSAFGTSASLPLNLVQRGAKAGTSTTVAKKDDAPTNTDDINVSGPRAKKVVLVPKQSERVITAVDDVSPDLGEKPPEEVKSEAKGVPAWVWIVTGVAVAAGAGVGGYFGIREATKPVTGTVTATW